MIRRAANKEKEKKIKKGKREESRTWKSEDKIRRKLKVRAVQKREKKNGRKK